MAEWKVERAKQHISDVEAITRWMIDPANYVVRSELDTQTRQYQLHIGPAGGGLPRALPLAIGDAVHNLRSGLDYLWSALERKANPDANDRRSTFPSHEEKENLVDLVSKRIAIKKAFPQAEAFIIDVIKPYKTGNFKLWVLGKLNNVDKHRLLLATYSIARFGKFVATSEDGGVIDLSYSSIQTPGPIFKLGFVTPFKLNDDAEIAAEIVFAESDLPPGQLVVQTLVNFAEAVSETIQAFRETFLPAPAE
ncbi:hypothetical protein B6S44_17960 [Bosea sp. Tri-44]|nr:hypothetical protein B6S44_17960 [Bosea sp. Tri-44]